MNYSRHLLRHEGNEKELFWFELLYGNEYDVSPNYVLDYDHDTHLMLIFSGNLKSRIDILSYKMFIIPLEKH